MSLCKYKNIFGEENTGAHSFRIFNIAVIDVVLTVIAAYFISKSSNTNFLTVFLILIILGIILHRIFCVNTTINKVIFGEIKS